MKLGWGLFMENFRTRSIQDKEEAACGKPSLANLSRIRSLLWVRHPDGRAVGAVSFQQVLMYLFIQQQTNLIPLWKKGKWACIIFLFWRCVGRTTSTSMASGTQLSISYTGCFSYSGTGILESHGQLPLHTGCGSWTSLLHTGVPWAVEELTEAASVHTLRVHF